MRSPVNTCRKFLKSEDATVSMEAVICFPVLLWALAATFVFWDVYYARSINMRAAYTIGDALSRETDALNTSYMLGMENLLTFLLKGQHASRLRVTTVVYDHVNSEFEVEWSYASNDGWAPQTTQTMVDYWPQIPPLARGDTAIVVETELQYFPFFNVGIGPLSMADFVVTRPRFGPQLVWERPNGTVTVADGVADEAEIGAFVSGPIVAPP